MLNKNGYFLMLLLPTDATMETMNILQTNAIPSILYQSHLIQTIWIHTTKHLSQHRLHGEGHGNLKWKGVVETFMPWQRSLLLSDSDIVMAG